MPVGKQRTTPSAVFIALHGSFRSVSYSPAGWRNSKPSGDVVVVKRRTILAPSVCSHGSHESPPPTPACPDPEDAAPLDADADAPPTPVDEVVESGLMGALSLHAMSMTGKRSSRFRMVVLIRIGTW
jgi:hypothetical protein